MKVSIAPVLVAGGLLIGTIVNISLNNRQDKEELIREIETLEERNKQHSDDLKASESYIKEKELELQEKEEKIKELEKKLTYKTTSRGVSNKGKLIGTFEATAYTDDAQSQGKWVGQTATGMKPQVGVVAVDPRVIPLGTKLYVEGYGNCIAGDTGGAIKGYRIDLFKNSNKECREWGRRKVKVYRRE